MFGCGPEIILIEYSEIFFKEYSLIVDLGCGCYAYIANVPGFRDKACDFSRSILAAVCVADYEAVLVAVSCNPLAFCGLSEVS